MAHRREAFSATGTLPDSDVWLVRNGSRDDLAVARGQLSVVEPVKLLSDATMLTARWSVTQLEYAEDRAGSWAATRRLGDMQGRRLAIMYTLIGVRTMLSTNESHTGYNLRSNEKRDLGDQSEGDEGQRVERGRKLLSCLSLL